MHHLLSAFIVAGLVRVSFIMNQFFVAEMERRVGIIDCHCSLGAGGIHSTAPCATGQANITMSRSIIAPKYLMWRLSAVRYPMPGAAAVSSSENK